MRKIKKGDDVIIITGKGQRQTRYGVAYGECRFGGY